MRESMVLPAQSLWRLGARREARGRSLLNLGCFPRASSLAAACWQVTLRAPRLATQLPWPNRLDLNASAQELSADTP